MNKRNTKILAITAIAVVAGFFIYNKTQGSEINSELSFGFTTDSHQRGVVYSGEGLDSGISVSTEIFDSFDLGLSFDAKKAFDQEDDTQFAVEVGASIFEDVNLGLGFVAYNGHNYLDGESEVYLEVGGLDLPLDPSLTAYYNADREWWTFEGAVGHSVKVFKQDVAVSAFVGNTETSSSDSHIYYGGEASVSHSLGDDLDLRLGVTYVDTDSTILESEFIFSAGLTAKF